jgi:hypothetical protein
VIPESCKQTGATDERRESSGKTPFPPLRTNTQIRKFGFRFLHGKFRVGNLAIEIRIAELENDGVGASMRSRAQEQVINSSIRSSTQPALILRRETIDLPNHGAGFDGDDRERSFFDRW